MKIIWMDDLFESHYRQWVEKFESSKEHFQGCELIYCTEKDQIDSKGRGEAAMRAFKLQLDNLSETVDDGSQVENVAFVIDVKITSHDQTLGIFGDSVKGVKARRGSDTGYKIGSYILANFASQRPSIYGNKFSQCPVLFLSSSNFDSSIGAVSHFTKNGNYQTEIPIGNNLRDKVQYTLLTKSTGFGASNQQEDFLMVDKWVRWLRLEE